MGGRSSSCHPSKDTVEDLFYVASDAGILPDITIDSTLLKYLSLNSSAQLSWHLADIQSSLSTDQFSSFTKMLSSHFQENTKIAYGGVGIIAITLSLLFEILLRQGLKMQTVKHPLQGTFGEETGSEIGALIRKYLTEVSEITDDPQKMKEETSRYEHTLNDMLLHAYTAMIMNGHMDSSAMKRWINGAAFHTHMQIHLVRIGAGNRARTESTIATYREMLTSLFNRYEEYLRKHVMERQQASGIGVLVIEPLKNLSHNIQHKNCASKAIENEIVNKILEKQQMPKVKEFFETTYQNLNKFINQHQDFFVQS
nr:PREDICTED: uncharacterized protein LOC107079155 [Lepisosteus oculatus]